MTWAAAGIGALIGGGTAALSGGDPLKGALLGGVTGGGGAYMNGLLSSSASGAAGAVPELGQSMAGAAAEQGLSPSAMGAMSADQMNAMQLATGNMTAPAPSFLSKMQGLLPGEVDPNSPEGALARYVLPKERAGYGQELTSGLLSAAPLLTPNEKQERPPASGPALSRPAPQPAGNMYMKFDRWRK